MEIIVSGRHLEVEKETKKYIDEKLTAALDFKSLKISSVRVILDSQKNRFKAEIIVAMKQLSVEADEETYDLYESIDAAVEKIAKQVKRYVDKKQDHHKKPSMRDTVKALQLDLEKDEEEDFEEEI
jgi:putative sigma-54 modulation protein